jgi:thymidine kinase
VNFTQPGRRTLVIGPMGSGKTEFSSRLWRDSRIALGKSAMVAEQTTTGKADRRRVFFIRSMLDKERFPNYPDDALAHRGGYERLGSHISHITNSFELEKLLNKHKEIGTWIIDEASFYDERTAYVVKNESLRRGRSFYFPTLILNFRREIFNPSAKLLLEIATDIIPLTAYCEHQDCISNSFYTYRYYRIEEEECPALYFDPLIIVGGDVEKNDPLQPNYCTRCDHHHYLPGKEYTFLILKPLGEEAARGNLTPLMEELYNIKNNLKGSQLYQQLLETHENSRHGKIYMNALRVPRIAEKTLVYLMVEQNLLSEMQLREISKKLNLDRTYLTRTLHDNRRPVDLEEKELWD